MTTAVVLGGHSNAPCSECHRFITFYSGVDPFIGEVKTFASDTFLKLRCPIHGEFSVQAGEFRDQLMTAD